MSDAREDAKLLDTINGPEDLKNFSIAQLERIAEEIRDRIVEVMPVNGGHFGSGLGIADLTVALHRVFDFKRDQFVLDVSHQCYPHKMLTGRNELYDNIRIKGGPAGYTRPAESPYDWWLWAHAGSSISTALGLARGNRDRDSYAVAIIGDASIPTGMSMEALNHWADLENERLIVILNDNDMSIAPTVGGLSRHLKAIKREAHDRGAIADGNGANADLGHFWSAFGHRYVGPVDGHDMAGMVALFERLKAEGRGAFVHVKTVKGKGHIEAEKDQWKWHAVSPAKKSGPKKLEFARVGKVPYTDIFAEAVIERARRDPEVEAITAAMPCGTGLRAFAPEFPDRFYDTGIAEQHAVGFAAGLAKAGKKVICAIYSTFMQRAYDQLFQEIALNDQPVVLCMDRGGIVGPDGVTHNGTFDIAYTRSLPRINIMAPADGSELRDMINMALDLGRPCVIRYPRTAAPEPEKEYPRNRALELGRADLLREGRDGAVLAYGSMVYPAMEAAEILARRGIELTVWNARFVRPLDLEMLRHALDEHPIVFTVEENSLNGGFGSACLEAAALNRLGADKILPIGLPDSFVEHGDRAEMLEEHRLDPASLANRFAEEIAGLEGRPSRGVRQAEAY
ncbi:MAG: 1-deoxy-D-xylulose-5-phosphate synthase [Planctomycetes bacterium]|nr:1-deoxy-D-xylulose-5-phosphate synthase [Planctomycetota bacterium]